MAETKPNTTLGSPVAPNPSKVAQTTINTDTTTINPNSSILNPVKPDGSPAPPEVKRAVEPTPGAPAVPFAPGSVSEVKTTLADKTLADKPEGSTR